MKWSSGSSSSLSNGSIVTLSLNNSNNNNSIGSNGSSTNSSNYSQNGGTGIIRSTAAAVRRHASDRRSIFYTNPDDMEIFIKNHNNKKMSPTLNTKRPSTNNGITKNSTQSSSTSNGNHHDGAHSRLHSTGSNTEADEMQRRKCENLISYFTNQIYRLNKELEIEKHSRDTHLAKIVKALLCFEAKLKSDQKQIRQQLYEKDTQLNRLASEMVAMREKYGVKDEETFNIESITQYCSNCRKQYYFLNSYDVGTQVTKRDFNCHDGIDKENNIIPTSSSEDGLGQVFSSEARRSKRYMSKRTSGTFREYLKTRNIDLSVNNDASNTPSAAAQRPEDMEQKPSNEHNELNFTRKGSMRRSAKPTVSKKCDNKTDDKINDTMTTSSVDSMNESNESQCHNDSINNLQMKCAAAANNAFFKRYDDDMSKPKTQFESSTDDWYASASDMDDSDGAVSKPYGYNAVNPVLECVNQILLQQSMDGIMDASTDEKAFNTPATNPSNGNTIESPTKETNPLKKRVHFSTQNSMVQVPRSDNSSNFYQMSSPIISTNMCNAKDSTTLSYATIYSNEYEPIGSENNSTNHYVDMDSKLGDDRPLIEKSKTPPALPPKPPNLLKFRQILKMPAFPMQTTATVKSIDNESEPDYCSIGDIQEAVKSVQIVADVHKNADDDVSSHASEETKTDMTDETFADIPKLPNVQAIISPKKDSPHNKSISQDNYVTKTSPSPPRAKPAVLPTKAVVANLLSEMNKSKNTLNAQLQKSKIMADLDECAKKTPLKLINQQKITMTTISETTATSPLIQTQSLNQKSMPIIKQNEKILMPIQAEFDWYNLDVEYGKLLPAQLIEHGKESESDEPKNFGVEYNLDAEFSLTSCSLSSDNNSSIESSGSTIHFVPITVAEDNGNVIINGAVSGNLTNDEEPTINKTNAQLLNPSRLKKLINKSSTASISSGVNDKSFDTFLEQTGLTAKPLPQKRKIFYNAPFV